MTIDKQQELKVIPTLIVGAFATSVLLEVANLVSIDTPEQISGSTSKYLTVVAPNGRYSNSKAKTDHQRQEVSHDLYDTEYAVDFLHLLGCGFCDPVILFSTCGPHLDPAGLSAS